MKKNKIKNTQLADQLKSFITDDYKIVRDNNKRYTQIKNPNFCNFFINSNDRRRLNFKTMAHCLSLKLK